MTSAQTELSLADCESIDREWTDRFAAKRGWEDFDLSIPSEELYRFLSYMDRMNLPRPLVLDAGCGWGRYVYRFSPRMDYIGIDHSKEMLKVAQEKNDRPYRIFVQGSTSAIPFPDQHFDGIWSCCALAGFPTKSIVDVLEEHRRVLKPRGIMMIIMADTLWDEEGVYPTEIGDMYQSLYTLPTFIGHVESTDFELLESDTNHKDGSFSVILRNP